MKKIALLYILSFFYLGTLAQPEPYTGTKNKKALEAFNEAVGFHHFREFEKGLESVDKAINKDDEYIDAYMLKADLLKELGRFEEAKAAYNKIIELNAEVNRVYLYMAQMQFAATWYAESKANLEKFLAGKVSDYEKEQAEQLLVHATFAAEAIKTPVDFNPENMGLGINSPSHEYLPGLTADEETFIFTRRVGFPIDNEDFFISKKVNGKWQQPVNLGPPVNTSQNEGSVTISTDGQFIFFTCCNRPKAATYQGREAGIRNPNEVYQGCDLYYSRLEGDKWSIPRHLGNLVNSPKWESQPSLSFDGLSLYFTSTRDGGFGGSDIWMSRFEDNKFQEPVNLGPNINTSGNEEGVFIHQDNNTLYFSSTGWPGFGAFDFFVSRRDKNGNWQKPVNFGYPINTPGMEKGILVSRSGDLAYYSTDKGKDVKGGIDIFSFPLNPEVKPQKLSYLKGVIFDAVSKEKLEATVELIDVETGEQVIVTGSNSATGAFLCVLQPGRNYALNVNKQAYLFHSESFAMKDASEEKPFILEVGLNKISVNNKVTLKNVFFATDSFALKSDSKAELNKLVEFLDKNPNVKIEIGGHTDNTGNSQKNLILSQQRAKSVYDYLTGNGIEKSRLTYKGYGDKAPTADNNTEEGRQKNRRTEITITEI